MQTDQDYMALAIAEAKKAELLGEVPVGAVVVVDGKVIGKGYNQNIQSNDPTAHAEVVAIRQAAEKIGNYRLNGARLYVTLEPCVMCAGAILHARIKTLVFGSSDPKLGAAVNTYKCLTDPRQNHFVDVSHGVLKEQCSMLLTEFFKRRRG